MKFLSKKYYGLSGLGLGFAGIAAVGLSAVIYMAPEQQADLESEFLAKKRACQKSLTTIGVDGEFLNRGRWLSVKIEGLGSHEDPNFYEREMLKASYLISDCVGYHLESFCFGSECGNNANPFEGIKYKLEYQEPSTVKEG